jgi:xylan 1,4-beta-xylosidase
VYTSSDLVSWRKGPKVFVAPSGLKNLYAPDVYYHPEDQKFYLYYSAAFSGGIGVAQADKPDGTFRDLGLLKLGGDSYDANLFRDTDGKLYLYYNAGYDTGSGNRTAIYAQLMDNPTTPSNVPPIFLFTSTEPWETNVVEAAWMLKLNGTYYLMYSGDGAAKTTYSIGYATSSNPTGPFTKYNGNPILKKNDSQGAYGLGHHSLVKDAVGSWWFVYHQKRTNVDGTYDRFITIDPLVISSSGVLSGTATRGTSQPAPIISTSQIRYEAEGGTLSGGATAFGSSTASNGSKVGSLDISGASVEIQNINGGTVGGTKSITVAYATQAPVSPSLDVIVNGTPSGSVSFPPTGGWDTFQTVTLQANLNPGTNNRIRLQSKATGGVDIDYIALPAT